MQITYDTSKVLLHIDLLGFKLKRFLGEGGYGSVYSVGSKEVIKITSSKEEAQLAIFSKKLKSNILPKFYGAWYIPSKGLYILHREELPSFKFPYTEKWWDITNSLDDSLQLGWSIKEIEEDLKDTIPKSGKTIFRRIIKEFKFLEKHKIYMWDLYPRNWGSRRGKIVLRDCMSFSPTLNKIKVPRLKLTK